MVWQVFVPIMHRKWNFAPMMRMLLLLMLLSASACRTPTPTVVEQREQLVERFLIAITYKGLEGMKRVPYRHAHLRLETVTQLSSDPPKVVYVLPCTARELEGHLYKLGLDPDIVSAVRYE